MADLCYAVRRVRARPDNEALWRMYDQAAARDDDDDDDDDDEDDDDDGDNVKDDY
jgi:hypothetical protein